MFMTYVVGSLPRPDWLREVIEDRKSGRLSEDDAGALLDPAIAYAVRMQERTGLDYVSDGEWRRESYIKVFSEHVAGFEIDAMPSLSDGPSDPMVTQELTTEGHLTTAAAVKPTHRPRIGKEMARILFSLADSPRNDAGRGASAISLPIRGRWVGFTVAARFFTAAILYSPSLL